LVRVQPGELFEKAPQWPRDERAPATVRAVRSVLAGVCLAVVLGGCGSSTAGAPSTEGHSPAAGRIERCVDRFLQRATRQDADDEAARGYVRSTYCARFESSGWIYDDGALKIDAHTWLEEGRTCATAAPGEPPRTVSCAEADDPGARRLDCALLHHVRRSEVESYVEGLRREDNVECDDGTPLERLGVP
jgi:hypothetical protein